MSDKEESIYEIELLKKNIKEHDKMYYVLSKPTISDKAYDMLVKKVEAIEKQYPKLITKDSPTQRVSNDLVDGFERVVHINKMLSLRNAYNEDELTTWFNNIIKRFLSVNISVISLKYKPILTLKPFFLYCVNLLVNSILSFNRLIVMYLFIIINYQ